MFIRAYLRASSEDQYADRAKNMLNDFVVEREGCPVTIVKPFLRKVAEDLKVDLNNANGNQMNTRQLGDKIINKLLVREV